jgi:hypothetical protein
MIGEAALVAAVRTDEAELAAADCRRAREEELLAVRRGSRYGVIAAEPARAVVGHRHDLTAHDIDDVDHGVPAAVRLRRVGEPATVAEPRRSRSARVDEPVVASVGGDHMDADPRARCVRKRASVRRPAGIHAVDDGARIRPELRDAGTSRY